MADNEEQSPSDAEVEGRPRQQRFAEHDVLRDSLLETARPSPFLHKLQLQALEAADSAEMVTTAEGLPIRSSLQFELERSSVVALAAGTDEAEADMQPAMSADAADSSNACQAEAAASSSSPMPQIVEEPLPRTAAPPEPGVDASSSGVGAPETPVEENLSSATSASGVPTPETPVKLDPPLAPVAGAGVPETPEKQKSSALTASAGGRASSEMQLTKTASHPTASTVGASASEAQVKKKPSLPSAAAPALGAAPVQDAAIADRLQLLQALTGVAATDLSSERQLDLLRGGNEARARSKGKASGSELTSASHRRMTLPSTTTTKGASASGTAPKRHGQELEEFKPQALDVTTWTKLHGKQRGSISQTPGSPSNRKLADASNRPRPKTANLPHAAAGFPPTQVVCQGFPLDLRAGPAAMSAIANLSGSTKVRPLSPQRHLVGSVSHRGARPVAPGKCSPICGMPPVETSEPSQQFLPPDAAAFTTSYVEAPWLASTSLMAGASTTWASPAPSKEISVGGRAAEDGRKVPAADRGGTGGGGGSRQQRSDGGVWTGKSSNARSNAVAETGQVILAQVSSASAASGPPQPCDVWRELQMGTNCSLMRIDRTLGALPAEDYLPSARPRPTSRQKRRVLRGH
eukprot:TRINITY_DN20986_c0_g1_i5.p1 TRINITY_DN20986_c0_g1~~TRINITY_DN20986_c0_g1_i5.p1  ORF type:complete len:636 (-),score=119.96 TRINITY_DN20986_c0_g1_i5:335-2242(-)